MPHDPTPLRGDLESTLMTRPEAAAVLEAAKKSRLGIPVILGPIARTGAQGELRSVYVYDPDENLVEIANMFEHIDTHYAIEAAIRQRKVLARCDQVGDPQPLGFGVFSRNPDCTP